MKQDVPTYRDFERKFRNWFFGAYDREDLWNDLKRRTQGKGEKFTAYISALRYIAKHFSRPSHASRLVTTAWRGLLPEYRNAMSDKIVDTLDVMEEYGRRWKQQKDLNSRYVPPPTADKMRVKGAAFEGASKQKVSGVNEEKCASRSTSANSELKQNGKKNEQAAKQTKQPTTAQAAIAG